MSAGIPAVGVTSRHATDVFGVGHATRVDCGELCNVETDTGATNSHVALSVDSCRGEKLGDPQDPMLRASLLRRAATSPLLPSIGRRAAIASAAASAAAVATAAYCQGGDAVPPFVLGGNGYDQNTFQGRLTHIQVAQNPAVSRACPLVLCCKFSSRRPQPRCCCLSMRTQAKC